MKGDMPRRLPAGCVEDKDRHGNIRIYLRTPGKPKIRLHGVPWTEPFMTAYEAAKGGTPGPKTGAPERRDVRPETWRWLCQEYLGSADYAGLDPVTKRRRRSLLEATYEEPVKPGASAVFADFPLARISAVAIAVLRDRKASTPDGANNTLKAVRAVFKWACKQEVNKAPHNPARDVPLFNRDTGGFHTWTVQEVRQYQARHPIGTKAYLALALLLYCGGRRSDVVVIGRTHMREGWLVYTLHKGRNRKPVKIEIPVLADLKDAIAASPNGHLTFLVTELGKPFTSNGFGNWFKDRCREAGLPHCSAHGVRKVAATVAAENGATEKQLMAMFGWLTSKMAEHYTKQAERKRLARAGMGYINLDQDDLEVPLFPDPATGGTNRRKNVGVSNA